MCYFAIDAIFDHVVGEVVAWSTSQKDLHFVLSLRKHFSSLDGKENKYRIDTICKYFANAKCLTLLVWCLFSYS